MFYFLNAIYFKITYTVQTFPPQITTNLMTFAVKRTLPVLLFIQTNIHWRHITGKKKSHYASQSAIIHKTQLLLI